MFRHSLSCLFGYVVPTRPTVAGLITAFPSVVHAIRIHGIYDKNRSVLYGMTALLAFQVVVTAICCGFYRCELYPSFVTPPSVSRSPKAVPLLDGQGCIAGPKHNWVGIYWASATLFYTASVW